MGKWGENISDSVVEDEWRIKQIRGKKREKMEITGRRGT